MCSHQEQSRYHGTRVELANSKYCLAIPALHSIKFSLWHELANHFLYVVVVVVIIINTSVPVGKNTPIYIIIKCLTFCVTYLNFYEQTK